MKREGAGVGWRLAGEHLQPAPPSARTIVGVAAAAAGRGKVGLAIEVHIVLEVFIVQHAILIVVNVGGIWLPIQILRQRGVRAAVGARPRPRCTLPIPENNTALKPSPGRGLDPSNRASRRRHRLRRQRAGDALLGAAWNQPVPVHPQPASARQAADQYRRRHRQQ